MNGVEKVKVAGKKYFEDKFTSPFWVTYIVSWCLWNWKVWYVTFFVDSDLLLEDQQILKMDYIESLYKTESFFGVIWIFCHLIICPALSAYLIVFIMPKITYIFYKKSSSDELREKELDMQNDKRLLEMKKSKLDVEQIVEQKEEEIKKTKLEAKTKEEIWNDEYKEFKKSDYYKNFNDIRECIYNHEGFTTIYKNNDYGNQEEVTVVDFNVKSYFDINGLIEIINEQNTEFIKLTDKGKYFMRKFMNDFKEEAPF